MLHCVSVPPQASHRCEFVTFYYHPVDGHHTFQRLEQADWNALALPDSSPCHAVSYIIIPETTHPAQDQWAEAGASNIICGMFSTMEEQAGKDLLAALRNGFVLPPNPTPLTCHLFSPSDPRQCAAQLRMYAFASSELQRNLNNTCQRALAKAWSPA